MSTPHKTPTALLLEARLIAKSGVGVVETVLRLADELDSWRGVAARLREETGIRVANETVRGWAIEWGYAPKPKSETAA